MTTRYVWWDTAETAGPVWAIERVGGRAGVPVLPAGRGEGLSGVP